MKMKVIITLFALFGAFTSNAQTDILLKDYKPKSIYKVPITKVESAKYPAIDMHSHAYATTKSELDLWAKELDKAGIKKTIILTVQTGQVFDSLYAVYSKYGELFEVWCGFDFTGYTEKGWSEKAIKELERCYKVGARGVGELADKGLGLYSKPTAALGMHIDDERMKPLLKKCGEMGMPINIHVADPYWMYEPIDAHNDGLMNAAKWKIDTSKKNIFLHAELIQSLENAVKQNSGTIFIACHFANCSHDLSILGRLLESYDNLYADISARYSETAPVPRYTKAFYEKHQDKLLYGTDMGLDASMYQTTFRILETEDEHFYVRELFSYHWPLHGLGLSDTVLKKLYYKNAEKIIK